MELNEFRLVDTFCLPINKSGVVLLPVEYTTSKHYLELEDIRRYPSVRQFIEGRSCFRLELKTLDMTRAFIFQRNKENISILYFAKE